MYYGVRYLVLCYLICSAAKFTLKQISGELFYQTLSLRQVDCSVGACNAMHLMHFAESFSKKTLQIYLYD